MDKIVDIYISPNKIDCMKKDTLFSFDNTNEFYNKTCKLLIHDDKFTFILNKNGVQLGSSNTLAFMFNIIKQDIASKTEKGKSYKVVHKELSSSIHKIYLYEQTAGWIYNGYTLLDKYVITNVPKIDLQRI